MSLTQFGGSGWEVAFGKERTKTGEFKFKKANAELITKIKPKSLTAVSNQSSKERDNLKPPVTVSPPLTPENILEECPVEFIEIYKRLGPGGRTARYFRRKEAIAGLLHASGADALEVVVQMTGRVLES